MTLAQRITSAPGIHNPMRAAAALEALAGIGVTLNEHTQPGALIAGTAGCSPFLARLIERESGFLADALERDPEEAMAALIDGVTAAGAASDGMPALMKALRVAKGRAALLIALCDLGGVWPLIQVTQALSAFADACVSAALSFLLREAAAKGTIALEADDPVATSGLFVLAMGKHGAGELNYSSDIDLILFFEHGARDPAEYGARKQAFNRLTRSFVKTLSEQTPDGYVFRTDLRLRPDPGSTAACLSTDAAERYYESFGKNWERAAYIKARIIAGDHGAGARFLEGMVPFVWRRTLDFATIADVRDMKRLIHRHKGHGEIRTAGHDLKLGRGGIREIEFFAQTQQLIAGGRQRDLRVRQTLTALDRLTEAGWVEDTTRQELGESYVFLRTLEHRLQMVEDAQTHRMPTAPDALEQLAAFAGYPDFAALDAVLRSHLERVAARFAALFEEMEGEEEGRSPLDGDLESALAEMGFADPARAAEMLGRWRNGEIAATRTERARAILDRIAPRLLSGVAGAADPDRALLEIDRFLSGLPAGVQILSLFEANPNLLDFLTGICAAAPRLAAYLGRNSAVLDAVLSRDFFAPTPGAEMLLDEHVAALPPTGPDFEEVLNASRRWNRERHFRIGAQLLRGVATPEEAGVAYADLAEACIAGLAPRVTEEMAQRHGPPPGKGACVLAMGRLGAHEMTAGSDLDLLVIYDDGEVAASDGKVPLAPTQYYARWTQRLVRALTAPTSEGAVSEVDMRLRPSGRSGPLATRIAAFERYQQEDAWTWEHMALTRARVVAGPPELCARVDAVIAAALNKPRDAAQTLADALEMRGRMTEAEAKASGDMWNMKLVRGGLVDADFIIQALLLAHGASSTATRRSVGALAALAEAGALDGEAAARLAAARETQLAVFQLLRLAQEGGFDPAVAPPSLCAVIASALGEPDFERVTARIGEAQADIHTLFDRVFGGAGR